ncbi:hypothetical protein [Halorussus litoreus]|uniref:hypothetical protein n=1 Tax=Halorussus litoreus TaxID=1710536 RepID=UPI000E23C83E|nr:hypothetical protein [Halorussus litoreus]
MKRRQFTAMVATATFSLGSIGSAAAGTAAQDTDPLRLEDASVSIGGVTNTIGEAALTYEESTMQFEVSDWTMESETGALSIASASMAAGDVSADTYATVRSAMVEAYETQSPSPLLTALAEADVDSDAPVQVVVESVETDGGLVADRIEATGTAGSVVPDGTRELASEGATIEGVAALGPSEWSQLSIQRGEAEFVAEDVTMEREGAALAVSSPGGEITVSERVLEFSEMAMTVSPPETIPDAHLEFASEVRQLAGDDDLSVSAVESAAEESGVTTSNTAEAVRNARFELSFAEISEGGETLVSDFATSGTLAELVEVLRQRA